MIMVMITNQVILFSASSPGKFEAVASEITLPRGKLLSGMRRGPAFSRSQRAATRGLPRGNGVDSLVVPWHVALALQEIATHGTIPRDPSSFSGLGRQVLAGVDVGHQTDTATPGSLSSSAVDVKRFIDVMLLMAHS